MPSTHCRLLYHVVFRVSNSDPMIKNRYRAPMHRFLSACVKRFGGVPIQTGGTADHVHLLVLLSPKYSLSELVRSIKTASSKFMHEEFGERQFRWQEGYGAFTVSPTHEEKVVAYIRGQEEHHRRVGFQEEYQRLLRKSGLDSVSLE